MVDYIYLKLQSLELRASWFWVSFSSSIRKWTLNYWLNYMFAYLRICKVHSIMMENDYDLDNAFWLLQSKRFVGVIDWGKPGGGAPMRNAIRTREDPMLRFQYSKDLRRAVDNNLRYKTNKMDQQIYKKQLGEFA